MNNWDSNFDKTIDLNDKSFFLREIIYLALDNYDLTDYLDSCPDSVHDDIKKEFFSFILDLSKYRF